MGFIVLLGVEEGWFVIDGLLPVLESRWAAAVDV